MLFHGKWLACVVTLILAWSEADAFPSVWKRDATSLSNTVPGVCNSSRCQQDATEILESLDKSVDPCDDFYMFACGGWKEKHPTTNDTPIVHHLSLIHKNVKAKAELILKEPISEDDISPLKAAKKMYQVCMDVTTIDRDGNQPLIDIFNEFGAWPMAVEDWNEDNFNLERTLVVFDRYLSWTPLIRVVCSDSPNDTSRRILEIYEEVGIGISLFDLLDPEFDNTRATYVSRIANASFYLMNATGVNVEEEKVILQASQVFEFMMQLQNISSENKTNEMITLKELQEWTDSILVANTYSRLIWLKFLNRLLVATNIVLDENEIVFVHDKESFVQLVKLLDDTPPRVIANYIQWVIIETEQERIKMMVEENTIRSDGIKSRSTYCSKETFDRFNHVLNSQYALTIYGDEDKAYFDNIVKILRSAFTNIISNTDWLDDESRSMVLEELDSLKVYSGYPDMYNNATALVEHYKQVHVGNEHLRNMLLPTEERRRPLCLLREPYNIVDSVWMGNSPDMPTAFYLSSPNAIIVMFGILQQVFFELGRLEALNYGRIGFIAGHELMHGVVETYKKGNWSSAEKESITDKWQCFVDQYNSYHIPELEEQSEKNYTVNGTLTFGENVADNTGMYAAYSVYKEYVKLHGTEQRLPGLEEYSPDQLFFIGSATVWCESRTNEKLQKQILRDEHSPKFARVRGSVSNMEQFATAFNCPAGSNMNPVNKCRMW